MAFGFAALVLASFCVVAQSQTVSPEVQQLYAAAQAAQANQDLKLAEADYRRILQLAPNLGPAYNNLGRILFNEARYDLSLRAAWHLPAWQRAA